MSSFIGRNSKDDTISIEDEHGTTIENDHEAADCFNEIFCSIDRKINSSIEKPISKVNISPENKLKLIYLFNCSYTEVFNLLQNLDVNKATGLDRITAKVQKL